MNYIRTLVSGKKKRFVDRKYNLDLSYITPRIIAMAYPGSGIEVVFRNNIDSVSIAINIGF
jgi:phosphatidylinositol-3,4,5-trisphosphate 3-phosphatase/dual-specificity protein phosphatase PTEN